MTVAVYPGSFDPVTFGHMDIARRAAKLFDLLIVAVYSTPEKKLLFSTDQRVEMMREALKDLRNVKVESYDTLTVDYVQSVQADVIVRGLRVAPDFEWEYQMAQTNKQLAPGVEMLFFMANRDYAYISSSIVKQVASLGGRVDMMVPPHVVQALAVAYDRGANGR